MRVYEVKHFIHKNVTLYIGEGNSNSPEVCQHHSLVYDRSGIHHLSYQNQFKKNVICGLNKMSQFMKMINVKKISLFKHKVEKVPTVSSIII